MKLRSIIKYLLFAVLFAVFPFRFEMDSSGHWALVLPSAQAKSGSGSDGNGGDDGKGDDGGRDDDGDDDDGDDDDDDGGDDDEDDDENRSDGNQKIRPVVVQRLSNGARVTYSDGSREEIRDGNFFRTQANGQVVERRRALGRDLAHMRSVFSRAAPRAEKATPVINSRAAKATYRGQNVEILYANGWREEIASGRFTLTDKYGRVVTSRSATQADRTRLNRFRK